jgi:hypothetical protein
VRDAFKIKGLFSLALHFFLYLRVECQKDVYQTTVPRGRMGVEPNDEADVLAFCQPLLRQQVRIKSQSL